VSRSLADAAALVMRLVPDTALRSATFDMFSGRWFSAVAVASDADVVAFAELAGCNAEWRSYGKERWLAATGVVDGVEVGVRGPFVGTAEAA
jgi:hypothetical protein